MALTPHNKEDWLKLLRQTSIPSFSGSIKALSSTEEYSSARSSELARIILNDPNLTASVLKLANSVHYNRNGKPIRTVSRSIVLLGHESIREVCVSCMLIEQFLEHNASHNLEALLARSFHAAIQTKAIALLQGQKSTEELFISTLLLNLGEIAVYSAIQPNHPLFQPLNDAYPIITGQEKKMIGCYFSDLTMGLCKSWNIAPMIGELLAGQYAKDSPLRSILLGISIATTCESKGIEAALQANTKSISLYTGQSAEQVEESLNNAAEDAQKSLSRFAIQLDLKSAITPENHLQETSTPIKIDSNLQLEIIKELTVQVKDKVSLEIILHQLLEGIQRGAGFSKSLIALLSSDNSRLSAKYVIESEVSQLKQNFDFKCYLDIPELLQKVMNNKNVILQTSLRPQGATLKKIIKQTATKNAVWGPLIVENKVIGCFYSDNGLTGPPITKQQIEAFEFFVYQAGFLLQKLK